MLRSLLLVLLMLCSYASACQQGFSLYLIGDAGELRVKDVDYKKILQQRLQADQKGNAVVFLGDNIYPKGMPLPGEELRAQSEEIIKAQIDLAGQAPVYFVPGNHDWQKGGKEGWARIREQQQFIDSLKNPMVHFFPKGGCPGPVAIPLSDKLVLVMIDTQWFLQQEDKPQGETSACEFKTEADVYTELDDILRRSAGKRVVVATHHPVYTYGEHGGRYMLKQHIFPLTDLKKNLFIPLPVIGSIYPLYRRIFGDIQDIANPVNKQFRNSIEKILSHYPGVIYASGHEHGLQYSWKDSVHYVVSGGGVKTNPVKKRGYARFVSPSTGFVRLTILDDGFGSIEYYEANGVVFKEDLKPVRQNELSVSSATSFPKEAIASASNRYTVSKTHEKWLGASYRKEWGQPISAPVFDIGKEEGGLKIIQRGGGMQTLSLRLQDSLGHEYTLRSIEKYAEKAIPEPFRKTFVEDVVQDQISSSHPYGAIAVPALAKAAGIYHTNPRVVYIPDDPRFGVYRRDVRNELMLFEERPAGSGKDMEFFGNAEKIIGTPKLVEKLAEDNDNKVDQKFVVRNRLFDMWIGDWDRHDDQWRWAEFDSKHGKTYRPIPRDRDQAFFVNQGFLPKLLSKPWGLPKFEGFDDDVDWPGGLMFNGRYFDRNFLTELTQQQWIETANDLTAHLTDDAIAQAFKAWPEEIYKLHGDQIIQSLKARRAHLAEYASRYYLFLAKEVDIVGSNKRELFEIEHQSNGNIKIQMFKLTKDAEKGKKLHEREFIKEETKEIRLYGLGGNDEFEIKGSSSKIKVRIIGGEGNDEVDAHADGGKTLVYDTKDGVAFERASHIRNMTSKDPKVNDYDRLSFLYNRYVPLVYGNYNVDDGIFIGGGTIITRNGFRKKPYKAQHLLLGSVALNTGSFNFKYAGLFVQLIGKWNLEVNADIKSPNYVNNFFGWGNESVFNQNINKQPGIHYEHAIQYYRMRFREYVVDTRVARMIGRHGYLKIGPSFQHIEIDNPDDNKPRYIEQYASTLSTPLLEVGKTFGGASYSWGIDRRDNKLIPSRGIWLDQTSKWMKEMSRGNGDYGSHSLSLSLYQTFKLPAKLTFAFRAGGGFNNGNYQLYQAQILDGKTELRGFRKTRFYGDSKMFFNNELRYKLGSFKSYLFPASIGVSGFYDVGRVWYKDSTGKDPSAPGGKSDVWHKGFGGGLWVTPFNLLVISTDIGHSNEGTLFYLRTGFLF